MDLESIILDFNSKILDVISERENESLERIKILELENNELKLMNSDLLNKLLLIESTPMYLGFDEMKKRCFELESELEQKKLDIKDMQITINIYEYEQTKNKIEIEKDTLSKLPQEKLIEQYQDLLNKNKELEEENKRYKYLERDYLKLEEKLFDTTLRKDHIIKNTIRQVPIRVQSSYGMKPTQQEIKPTQEAIKPTQEAIKPIFIQRSAQVPTKPIEEQTTIIQKTTEEPTKPIRKIIRK